jgi:hypothetical protein
MNKPLFSSQSCGDCGVQEGAFHHPQCDQAICNRCGGQYLSCTCPPHRKLRVKYIAYPQRCIRCGCAWPEHFSVSNADWRATVQKDHRDAVLCLTCFEQIRSLQGLSPCPCKLQRRHASVEEALAEMRGISVVQATHVMQAVDQKSTALRNLLELLYVKRHTVLP